ncbi:carotenoid biosynthesis protein [Pontibacter fetidus]|uniref:Carotenoid biosynthesis protein n=1 Tax=Pontibacter fetidus TaxID=2700082 RepID=A0A6B2GVT1_9BACT|nr:carotenoid biosynthesis protein [Pontibacter fetidus]NDK54915.1 carotenoid biosynthesis protein [Pontibacter fetidus]
MIRTIEDNATTVTNKPARAIGFWVCLAVLVIFHAVGFWGLMFSGRPMYFQELTPLNLLLTNALLFSLHRTWNAQFLVFAVVVTIASFLAEVLGIHTGLLFGNYSYGAALGLKLWDVPLLIGLNWLMLVYSTGTIVTTLKVNPVVKALAGAGLMVLLDFFLEPVAMRFDFWVWQDGVIPVSNFVGWFGLAFLLQLYFHTIAVYKQNPLTLFVYLVQLLFFIGLYLML